MRQAEAIAFSTSTPAPAARGRRAPPRSASKSARSREHAALQDLVGAALRSSRARQRLQERGVDDDRPRLVEGADQVLGARVVDADLAADRAVDHRQQRGRHLDPVDAAHVGGGGEAGHVAHHAAAEGDHQPVAAQAAPSTNASWTAAERRAVLVSARRRGSARASAGPACASGRSSRAPCSDQTRRFDTTSARRPAKRREQLAAATPSRPWPIDDRVGALAQVDGDLDHGDGARIARASAQPARAARRPRRARSSRRDSASRARSSSGLTPRSSATTLRVAVGQDARLAARARRPARRRSAACSRSWRTRVAPCARPRAASSASPRPRLARRRPRAGARRLGGGARGRSSRPPVSSAARARRARGRRWCTTARGFSSAAARRARTPPADTQHDRCSAHRRIVLSGRGRRGGGTSGPRGRADVSTACACGSSDPCPASGRAASARIWALTGRRA